MPKLEVAIIFGGRSVEHEMPATSAQSIYEILDRDRYNPILVCIAPDGRWWLQENPKGFPLHVDSSGAQLMFVPGGGGQALLYRSSKEVEVFHVDVVYPILPEGLLGGALELAQVPFVGSRMPAPAICMDKEITRRILRDAGLPIARSVVLATRGEMTFQFAQQALCSPALFVKPLRLHSSIGVSKVTCESEFEAAVDLAFAYDRKILLEEYVQARELECAILQDPEEPIKLLCSWPGEVILTDHAFFTYQAKLDGKGVKVRTKAQLEEAEADRVRALCCNAFRVMGCEALARVDVLMRPNGELLINEVGSMPSLSPFGMFSRMMEGAGIPYNVLIPKLLEHAIMRSRGPIAVQ